MTIPIPGILLALSGCSVPLGGGNGKGEALPLTGDSTASTSGSGGGTSTSTTGGTSGTSTTGDTTTTGTSGTSGTTGGTAAEPEYLLRGVKQLSGYGSTNCALTSKGEVWCWGDGGNAILGSADGTDRSKAVKIAISGPARQVAVGGGHACALLGSGEIECWGKNDHGQVGNGSTSTTPVSSPVEVSGLDTPYSLPGITKQIALGESFSCALLGNGTVKCWGEGTDGQLGNGGTSDSASPVKLALTSEFFSSISAGASHACGVSATTSRSLYCWGAGASGRKANGSLSNSGTPSLAKFVDSSSSSASAIGAIASVHVYAGKQSTCLSGLFPFGEAGALSCAGIANNGMGGTTTSSSETYRWRFRSDDPVVFGSSDPRPMHVSLGSSHACAVTTDGGVWCWGSTTSGKVDPSVTVDGTQKTPKQVDLSALKALEVVAGESHSCILSSAGTVYCWGDNSQGQLGSGDLLASTTPVQVHAAEANEYSHPRQLVAGWGFACALIDDGTVKCWGDNSRAQLGFSGPVSLTSSSSPVSAQIQSHLYRHLSAGGAHVCGIEDNGSVSCWGANFSGALGSASASVGLSAKSYSPVTVQESTGEGYATLDEIVALSAGWTHTCAVTARGKVLCWGENGSGQLGNDSTRDSSYAVTVLGRAMEATSVETGTLLSKFAPEISSGAAHTCAVSSTGAVYCWGSNSSGQLLQASTTSTQLITSVVESDSDKTCSSPSEASGLLGVETGGGSTCTITAVGSILCGGANSTKQALPSLSETQTTCLYSAELVFVAHFLSGEFVTAIRPGTFHSCALSASGKAHCWGDNSSGQLAQGSTSTLTGLQAISPSTHQGGVIDVALGASILPPNAFTCLLMADGTVECAGDNSLGQLGDGTTDNSSSPVSVAF